MSNVLITGVSGYLGRRLAEELSRRDDVGTLIGIDVVPPGVSLGRVEFYRKDIRDPGIGKLLADHGVDTVMHLAFVVQPIHDLARMHDIDYSGTRTVLEQSAASGVKQVIAISSTLAYGAHEDNPMELTEDAPLRGNRSFPYGHDKAGVDRMIQEFARQHPDMVVTILRPCTVFGPTVNNYVSRMLFLPVTAGVLGYNPPVQFVHEDDFVDACILAFEKKTGGAYNITGDGILSLKEIAQMIGTRIVGMPARILYPLLEILWRIHTPGIEVNRGYLDYVRYPFVASNAKAKKHLGFAPRYTSRETLFETIRRRKDARNSA
ncbi:MAG: SDR family oxidoreductase [Desulfomonilia bacterium]